MIDVMKKTLFTGIGLATLTKEKLQELGREVAEKAKLSEAQAQEFQEELESRADQAQCDLQATIDHRVEQALQRVGLARREQVEELARASPPSKRGSTPGRHPPRSRGSDVPEGPELGVILTVSLFDVVRSR